MKWIQTSWMFIWAMSVCSGSFLSHLHAEDEALTLLGWEKSIEILNNEQEEIIAVPVDSEVYNETQQGLADLRIVDNNGQTVPYLLRKQTEQKGKTVRHTWRASNLSINPGLENGLDIRFMLKEDDPQPDGLKVVTPLTNFEQRVQVYAVDSNGEETLLVEDGLIFDYAQYIDIRKTDIALPQTKARTFRIVITTPTAAQESQLLDLTSHIQNERTIRKTERFTIERRPFRIDQLEFWSERIVVSNQTEKTQEYKIVDFSVSEDKEHKLSIIDIHTLREPLTSFIINTPSRNFSRAVEVFVIKDKVDQPTPFPTKDVSPQNIASSMLTRIDFRELQEEHLSIAFPSNRDSHFQIRIHNKDNSPLEFESVTARGQIDELVFLALPQHQYKLLYGSEDTEPAAYDVAALQLAVAQLQTEEDQLVMASLGDSTKRNITIPDQPFNLQFLLNSPLIIGGIGAVLTLLLGVLLYKASHLIDKDTSGDST